VPTSIARQSGELVATISITPDEGELGAVTASVQQSLAELELPQGVTAEIGGLAETQTESFEQLGLAMLVAIAIVFMLLVATFRSLRQPLILLVSIPFAATGAIALLLATGRPLGISALIGMLMLIGIVVTNAIVLIDLVNQYRAQGQRVADAVFNGARQRLRPILMTALATIFALMPMAFGVTGSSGFISQDLAIVVIGGLISSTLLTLVLVPVLYLLVEGRRERREAKRAAKGDAKHAAAAGAATAAAIDA
jgi:HAE1 family hydrophobic/amphiphilic exporter-1